MKDLPPLPRVEPRIANRGPWTILRLRVWPGFYLGQTTAVAASGSADFSAARRRDLFFSRFPIRSYHEAQQVHGARLREAQPYSCSYPGVDGLMAARRDTLLSIRTADCLPVYLKDPGDTRFALLHAGWRGLAESIVTRAVKRWFPRAVCALIGAGISQSAYEVGDEVHEALAETLEVSRDEFVASGMADEQGRVDLARVVQAQLRRSPARVETVARAGFSTDEAPVRLFSHRRNETTRRMVHWIYRTGGS